MLFNSFEFVFLFLPITLGVFFVLGRNGKYVRQQIPVLWLVGASLFFYGWWKPVNLPLIIISILVNYSLGYLLRKRVQEKIAKKGILLIGIIFEL